METKYKKELDLAIEASEKAGKKILDIYKKGFSVYEKDDKSPVTDADLAADKIIKEILESTGIPVLSEESYSAFNERESELIWIVDPLDGTSGFIKKTDHFCVMIGLIKNNKPVLGVIYIPISEKLYYAVLGMGAYLKESGKVRRIKVSEVKALIESNLVTTKSHFNDKIQNIIEKSGIEKFTRVGSAIKMCLIAEGSADLAFNPTNKMNEWDTCAADIIIKEASGTISDINGNELLYNQKTPNHKNGIIVSNGLVHREFIEKVKGS